MNEETITINRADALTLANATLRLKTLLMERKGDLLEGDLVGMVLSDHINQLHGAIERVNEALHPEEKCQD